MGAVLALFCVSWPLHADTEVKSLPPIYSGKLLIASISWEGEGGVIPAESGLLWASRAGLHVEGFALANLLAGFRFGYRWHDNPASGIVSMPHAGFVTGYRIAIPSLFSVTPEAGFDYSAAIRGRDLAFHPEITAALRLSCSLVGRYYLTLSPTAAFPLMSDEKPRISVFLGSRKEIAVKGTVQSVRPSIQVGARYFSPDGDGSDDTLDILCETASPRSIRSWAVEIRDQQGNSRATYSGTKRIPARIRWDGNGQEHEPGERYTVFFSTIDHAGRTSGVQDTVMVDILLIEDGDRFKIRVPAIRFPPWSARLDGKGTELFAEHNRTVVRRIAQLFNRFPEYHLIIEGHANSEQWNDPAAYAKEQKDILIPLSLQRAESVRNALAREGIAASRMSVRGEGSGRPVVPFENREQAVQNRRVDFILEKRTSPQRE